jgi:hypothetical protein
VGALKIESISTSRCFGYVSCAEGGAVKLGRIEGIQAANDAAFSAAFGGRTETDRTVIPLQSDGDVHPRRS